MCSALNLSAGVEEISDRIPGVKQTFYVGAECPTFAESYDYLVKFMRSIKPDVEITDDDNAAIYFSSGTTGFPKAILHSTQKSCSFMQLLNKNITDKLMMMCSCAYLRFTIRVPKCTGSGVLFRAVKPYF